MLHFSLPSLPIEQPLIPSLLRPTRVMQASTADHNVIVREPQHLCVRSSCCLLVLVSLHLPVILSGHLTAS